MEGRPMRNGVVAARRSYTTLMVPMHGPRLSAPVPACEPSVWPVHRAGALAWGAQGRTLFVGMIDCMSCELVSCARARPMCARVAYAERASAQAR